VYVKSALAGSSFFSSEGGGFSNRRRCRIRPENRPISHCGRAVDTYCSWGASHEARRRIRQALELFVDDARKASIVDDVKLPNAATKAIRAYALLRRKADEEDHDEWRGAGLPGEPAIAMSPSPRASHAHDHDHRVEATIF
jgi:hypothetical protein